MRPLDALTIAALEWDRLLSLVAGHARSPLGSERCRTLVPAEDVRSARQRLEETTEVLRCAERGMPVPAVPCPDIRPSVDRAAKGAMLDAPDLRDIARVLAIADDVAQFVRRHRDIAPALAALTERLAGLDLGDLRGHIERCVDDEGHIREGATPELRRLMHHAQDLKQGMRRRLDAILSSARYAEVLQEQYFAQREGRYVVPVKAEQRSKIPGIVHDVSSSGATVFLEPRELVELNNAIKVADLDVEREVRRILQSLSADVAAERDALLAAVESLAELDAVSAKAAFSERTGGRPIALNTEGRIALKQVRHPLLLLSRARVVPNDIMLDARTRVLVISGPNTGGKTVTLKILGLTALMVRAGLLPSCDADSDMAFFANVFADVGDAQDLARDLSSFSAHVLRLIELLQAARAAVESDRSWLVLLDELATSTDPTEGAALAEAVLRHLAGLGMTVVVTTHYQALKALAQTAAGFMNASVGFDVPTLAPTYRLLLGVPGGSSALDIAGRLGLDEPILEQAVETLTREAQGREARRLDQMLADVQAAQRHVEEDRAAAATLREDAERAAREAAEILERLRATERDERKGIRRKLTDELLRARAEVQKVLDELKQERSAVRARDAKQRIADIETGARQRLEEPAERVPLDALRVGDIVEISGLGTTAMLLELPAGKKRVRIRAGDTELLVAASRLVGRKDGAPEPGPTSRPVASRAPTGSIAEAPVVVDVRGQIADEALEHTVAALDRATLGSQGWLRIIHGHGTGRLKAAIREYLRTSPYVAAFRAGDRSEGGDGVTVVELKR